MAELFESNWSATKDALLEGLNGPQRYIRCLRILKDIPAAL